MPGPWEKYQKVGAGPWEKYKSLEVTPTPEQPMAESAIKGALQGASFGYADELEGGVKAVRDVMSDKHRIADLLDRYRANRDVSRGEYEKARQDNPASYTSGEVAGTIGTAFVPGLGWANAAKGATTFAKLLVALKAGGAAGFGTSTADVTKGDLGNALEDTAVGAGLGAGTQGLLSGAGALVKGFTPTNVAKKLSNVFLNTPEEITETYIKNPAGVKNAPAPFELAQNYQKALERLKNETVEGSQASRAILSKEGQQVGGNELAELLQKRDDDIVARMEGVWDDPEQLAAHKWLSDKAAKLREPGIVADDALGLSPEETQRMLSTNRVKDMIQGIDRTTQFETKAGEFNKIDDLVKKGARSDIDSLLKERSPAYAEQMKEVAKDAGLLEEATEVAKSPGALANAFKRIERDQTGSGYFPRDVIGRVDDRLGTDFLEQAKLSNAKDAFDKSVTNGSMNVNKFSNMLKKLPGGIGDVAGPLLGGTVDKYGRKMTMGAVDTAVSLNKLLQSGAVQDFQAQAKPLMDAVRKGDPTAVLTFQMLSQSNPDALKYLEQGE